MQDSGSVWPARRRFFSSPNGGANMTAIALDYTSSGFAVAADGKAHWQAENAEEDPASREAPPPAQKIFKIQDRGRVMAYALTGVAFSDDRRFSLVAQAKRSAESLASAEFDDPRAYIRRFSIPIKEFIRWDEKAGLLRDAIRSQ